MSTRPSLIVLIAGALLTAAAGAAALAAGGRAGLLFATLLVCGVLLLRYAHRLAVRRAEDHATASPPQQATPRPWGRKGRELVQLRADLSSALEQLADREHTLRELSGRLLAQETAARGMRQSLQHRLIEIEGTQRAERTAVSHEREHHRQELAGIRHGLERQDVELTALERLLVQDGER